jgi:hypothetical protein
MQRVLKRKKKKKKGRKLDQKYLPSILTHGDRPVAKVEIAVVVVIGSVMVVRVEESWCCTNLSKQSRCQ